MKMTKPEIKVNTVPPDGGWGWVVCFAYALNNVIVLPLISGFGLIFQETFTNLEISATQASVIINVNYAFGMVLSMFNGPMLKSLGYRKVAIAGALFVSAGVLLTSMANSFFHFLITYSLMTSVGIALTMSSFSLAINSYFRKNRGKAMAVGMSITGLGPIFMPQVINALMISFGVQGAVLILGGLTLHSLLAAFLLRPIKWYLVKPEENPEEENPEEENIVGDVPSSKNIEMKEFKKSTEYFSEDEEDYMDDDQKSKNSMKSLDETKRNTLLNRRISKTLSHTDITNNAETLNPISKFKWWKSASVEIHLGSSVNIFDDKPAKLASIDDVAELDIIPENKSLMNGNGNHDKDNEKELERIEEKVNKESFGRLIVKFFDLELLADPIFVNIMLGISLAACAEINFSLLTPFILSDMNFTTAQIAAILSVIAFADILFRFISPFIGEWCKKSTRSMYLISLIMLIFTRSLLLYASSYLTMMVVALGLGISKGVRAVYLSLVMPTYVPIERLAFASGIQMMTNGIILLTIGPLLGYIRDYSGSYNISIIFINIVSALTILMWLGEFALVKYYFPNYKKTEQ